MRKIERDSYHNVFGDPESKVGERFCNLQRQGGMENFEVGEESFEGINFLGTGKGGTNDNNAKIIMKTRLIQK